MAYAIEVNSVTKTFVLGPKIPWPRRSLRHIQALVDVSMHLADGEVFGLVGRNGYGKTTLIKCICSLVEPTSGAVQVLGMDPRQNRQQLRRSIGYVGSDERSFYWRLTGRQNLQFFARLQGVEQRRFDSALARLAERFDVVALLDRRFQEYSTGNRQRLSIVRALLHDPRILILDEPTRSLDPFAAHALRVSLMNWIEEDASRSILITSHNLSEVEQLSHRVGIMSRGRLLEQGSLGELRSRFDDRERVRIWVDCSSALLAGDFMGTTAEDVQVGEDPDHGRILSFRHRARDEVIHQVLHVLLGLGAKVTSFERTEMSLQDIIDHVDGRSGAE